MEKSALPNALLKNTDIVITVDGRNPAVTSWDGTSSLGFFDVSTGSPEFFHLHPPHHEIECKSSMPNTTATQSLLSQQKTCHTYFPSLEFFVPCESQQTHVKNWGQMTKSWVATWALYHSWNAKKCQKNIIFVVQSNYHCINSGFKSTRTHIGPALQQSL